MECVELAPLSNRPTPYDSASKLDALQTLRAAVHPHKPSQLAKNPDYCSAKGRRRNRLEFRGEANSAKTIKRSRAGSVMNGGED